MKNGKFLRYLRKKLYRIGHWFQEIKPYIGLNMGLLSADIFSLNLATAPQACLFLSRIIKLLINATLSLPHPSSQAPFLS